VARLWFRYAAMNAGKTSNLLQVAHNYEENGERVLLLTSSLDDRSGRGVISSRIGLRRDAETYDSRTRFDELLRTVDVACVLIDEAQFLTEAQVRQLHRWVHTRDIPVMCFGLRTDFQGNAFPGAAALLLLADTLEEIRTACRCGKKATMNIRVDENGQRLKEGTQVLIGGNDRYRQVCARCFYS
jgi:thymidine kinase